VIVAARYLTFGCTSAIAASEALCAIIETGGFTPIQALRVTNQDIVNFLDGLPKQKIHCSVMGAEALQAAVFNWAQKRGVDLARLGIDIHAGEQEEGRIVCNCFSLTEPYLRRKIRELNLHTIAEITNAVKAGGACAACHHVPGGLQDLLNETWGNGQPPTKVLTQISLPVAASAAGTAAKPALSSYQFNKQVEKAIDQHVRPLLRQENGDVEIVDIKDMLVYCRLSGACQGCCGAGRTLKMVVERSLKDLVDERIRVIEV
jgi:NifU-like protein